MNDSTSQIVLVKDINPGNDFIYGYIESNPRDLKEFNSKLYFTANNGVNGRELWVSDGTSEGTVLVADINLENFYGYGYDFFPADLTELNDKLYFGADDGVNGRELWVSDGTAEGTQLVADINPERNYYFGYGSYPYSFTELNGLLYFSADDGINGRELWVSDGTNEGTQLLADIDPDSSSYDGSYPRYLTEFNGKLYFSANDGINGSELWVSDGTSEGTQLLADINSRRGDDFTYGSSPRFFTELDDKLYFRANGGVDGSGLWVSDGTSKGTQLVVDTNTFGDFSIYNLTEFNGKLYFTTGFDRINGSELWVSDGTVEGTQLVADINPGRSSSYPNDLTEFNGKLYFSADDGVNGRELWVSDGTAEGTQLVADINSDGDSDPGELTVVGEELYFNADDEINGRELFKLTFDDSSTDINATEGADELVGTDDADDIDGLSGRDTISGGAGNDTLNGGDGKDRLFGETGDDRLFGDSGRDALNGGGGDDTINGGRGNDNLFGAIGDDLIIGGIGDDTLNGSGGNDILTGGSGNDTFIIKTNRGEDRITDFKVNRDILSLAGGLEFSDLSFFGNTIAADEEILAILDGVNTEELTETSFKQFEI